MISANLQKALGPLNLDLNFTITAPGITVISGPSGSGKSSLVKLIAGLNTPDSGWLNFGGKTLYSSALNTDIATHQRRLAIVFQEARLLPHWTVKKNLTMGQKKIESFDKIVAVLGIEALLSRKPKHLSGGEAQRVALGRALCQKPELLMMDEPLASLDEERKEELLPYIKALPKKFNIPILYVTHSTKERNYLADTYYFLEKGKLTMQEKSTLTSTKHPQHLQLLSKVR
ncbi:MAG: ATP-binding cassette domain-containing protein [SAR324 cluster bacterium]|nr:ATP-binding cassette domain-containing protein [SAR324 cluster bacterium]